MLTGDLIFFLFSRGLCKIFNKFHTDLRARVRLCGRAEKRFAHKVVRDLKSRAANWQVSLRRNKFLYFRPNLFSHTVLYYKVSTNDKRQI